MPASGDQVRSITCTDLDDTALAPFLEAANCIVERASACIAGKGVSQDCIDLASSYLASHLFTLSCKGKESRTIKRETFENYTVEYAVSQVSGQGILSTTYGQAANGMLGGCLSEVDKQQSVICFFG